MEQNQTQNTPPLEIISQPPVPTMRIADEDQDSGFVIINKSDFDPDTMDDFDKPKRRRSGGNSGEGNKTDGNPGGGSTPPAP